MVFHKPKTITMVTNIQVWPGRIVTARGKTRRQFETLEDRMIPRSIVGVHRGPGRSLDSWCTPSKRCTPLVNQNIVERTFVTRCSFEERDRSCELTGRDHKNRRQTDIGRVFIGDLRVIRRWRRFIRSALQLSTRRDLWASVSQVATEHVAGQT